MKPRFKSFKKMDTLKVVVVSGYFDPIHVGHLEMIENASKLGDILTVIVNSDHQARLKKGEPFMPEKDRAKIVSKIQGVDNVFLSVDKDKTVCASLSYLSCFTTPKPSIFANGGDRKNEEIPEAIICEKFGIEIVDGMGDKIRSSSDFTGLKES
jgi:D-beta-D-heptose 7-phosphate kinase/D-beta-D-heptose 1-phosphate adenosyltransferase